MNDKNNTGGTPSIAPFISPDVSVSIRLAKSQDIQTFIDLWKICFEDTNEFVKWFFEHRFFPEYSACVEVDGIIICAMQSMPLSIWIRGRSMPGAIVVGVCTHPDYRGHHYMKRMFTYYMQQMSHKGILAITYKPENIKTYFSLGHYPTTRTIHYEVNKASNNSVETYETSKVIKKIKNYTNTCIPPDNNVLIFPINQTPASDLNSCYELYRTIAPTYSGMVDRNKGLFILKSQDYSSVGGKLLLSKRIGVLTGYCFYFETEDKISGEELIARDYTTVVEMLEQLHMIAQGRSLTVKIPSNFKELIDKNNTSASAKEETSRNMNEIDKNYTSASDQEQSEDKTRVYISPQNVLGITHIKEFVRLLALSGYEKNDMHNQIVVEIRDDILEENNIKINLSGETSDQAPCIIIGIGYFVQVLCGYSSIKDLLEESGSNSANTTTTNTTTSDATSNSISSNSIENKNPIIIHDMEKAQEIDKILQKCECFIVDEY